MNREMIEERGAQKHFESPVVQVAVSRGGKTLAALTADGELILMPRANLRQPEHWSVIAVHDGGLCLTQDCEAEAFLSGGEDGRLVRTRSDGTTETLHEGRKWIDCVATTATHMAFSKGKELELRQADGMETLKKLDHPSTVTGLAFDVKGKRIVASHYNGVSMWFVQAKVDTVRPYEWKGSHIGVVVHPRGEAIVSSMQENDLHGWRMADGHNMRMSGYPKQVRSMCFTRDGRWLVTSGADAIVLWPFFGGGPMGKPPIELARLPGFFVSAVSANPQEDIVAAGFEDGTVLLAEIGGSEQRVLPLCAGMMDEGARGRVNALAFTPQGGAVIFGTEKGVLGVVDLSSAS